MAASPTFVIAGGQRCGTTSLCRLLDAHPDVYVAKPLRPEPKFFLLASAPGRDRRWYVQRWFHCPAARRAAAAGEKSVSYLEHPQAAERMRAMFPELRVVVLLRHPVERAWSNYRFSRRHGYETAPFEWAVRHEAERTAATAFPQLSAHPWAYVRRGRYAELLAPYVRLFGPDRLHVLLLDELLADTRATLDRLFRFLRVDPARAPASLALPPPPPPERGAVLTPSAVDYLMEMYEEPNRRLERLLDKPLDCWRRLSPRLLEFLRAPAPR